MGMDKQCRLERYLRRRTNRTCGLRRRGWRERDEAGRVDFWLYLPRVRVISQKEEVSEEGLHAWLWRQFTWGICKRWGKYQAL